ncbi:MAG: hypothetical protein ACKPKO_31175, partial [Candidatus Fonsibacter sp.]
MKARLVGDASIYQLLLDREILRDPNDGVDYLNNELRPHFVKGMETVFVSPFLPSTTFVQRLTIAPAMDRNS